MKPPLPFADPPTLASMLEKGHGRPNQWMACCPCHADEKPSLSIRWGRNGNTVVSCKAGCKWGEIRDYCRDTLHVWLSPPKPSPKPKKPKQPVSLRCGRRAGDLCF